VNVIIIITMNPEEFGNYLKRRREELGLNIRDVAWQLFVTPEALIRIEDGDFKGVRLYVRELLLRYCRLLKLDEKWCLEIFEEMEKAYTAPEKQEEEEIVEKEKNVFDLLVLGILYGLVVLLLIAGFYLFDNLKHFEEYNSLKVQNLGDKEVRLKIDGLGASYFVVKPDETLKLKVGNGMTLNVDNPAGMVRIILGDKAWEIRMKRFVLEVEYGGSKGG